MTVNFRTPTTNTAPNTTSTLLSLTKPTGTAKGNLLVAMIATALTGITIRTPPAGWVEAVTATGFRGHIWYKVATATEPASYVFYFSAATKAAGVMNCLYGPTTASYFEASPTANTYRAKATTTSTPKVTGITVGVTQSMLWLIYGRGATPNNTVPTGFTARGTVNFSTLNLFAGVDSYSPAGAESNVTVASGATSLSTWGAVALVLKPPVQPPLAPVLGPPANGAFVTAASGTSVSGKYRSADTAAANAYAVELKLSTAGSYSFWNASTAALQSTVVWNAASVEPTGTQTVALPSTAVSNGHTYSWSMAFQESIGNLQGPFATPFAFTSHAPPTLTVTAPTGTVATSRPFVTWTATPHTAAAITKYQVVVFTQAQYSVSGFTPATSASTWNSGVVTSSASSVQVGVTLTSGVSYRAYVQVTQTGTDTSAWVYSGFTTSFEAPLAPTVTLTSTTTATTGCPILQLAVQTHDNFLTATTAAPMHGVGTWSPTNASLTHVTPTVAPPTGPDGALAVTATAAGDAYAATGHVAVVAGRTYTGLASFLAVSTARKVRCSLVWLNSTTGELTQVNAAYVTDKTTAWVSTHVSGVAPVGATHAYLQVLIATAAASEVHDVAVAGIMPGTTTEWGTGGFAGNTQLIVTRSDTLYLRGASPVNPKKVAATQAPITLNDFECIPGTEYNYSVVEQTTGTTPVGSAAAVSNTARITTIGLGWWELDPTAPTTAVNAQMTGWQPVQTEQSTAHMVMGQKTMQMVANEMMNQDFQATVVTFTATKYTRIRSLMASQKTLWVSSPYTATDCGYFRVGPQTGGLSTGMGNKIHTTTLQHSSAGSPYRTVAVTAVAQPRPTP